MQLVEEPGETRIPCVSECGRVCPIIYTPIEWVSGMVNTFSEMICCCHRPAPAGIREEPVGVEKENRLKISSMGIKDHNGSPVPPGIIVANQPFYVTAVVENDSPQDANIIAFLEVAGVKLPGTERSILINAGEKINTWKNMKFPEWTVMIKRSNSYRLCLVVKPTDVSGPTMAYRCETIKVK